MKEGSVTLAIPAAQPAVSTEPQVVRQGHVPELDGIRGIAVLMVIFHHIAQNFPPFDTSGYGGHALALWLRLTTPGWLGVDVFFVLSGFLITGVLLDAKGQTHFYRNFYMKRILRIFPLYYATLIVMVLFFPQSWAFFGLCAVYLANFSVLFGVPLILAPLWSLSVEEHFYFLWPWVIKFCKPSTLFFAAVAICVIEPLARFWTFRHGGFNPYFSWFRFDGLALGAIVAVLVRSRFARFTNYVSVILCVLGVLIFVAMLPLGGDSRLNPAGTAVLYTCASLVTAGAIAFVCAYPFHWASLPLRVTPLRFVGDISYCLYLVHMFVILGFYSVIGRVLHQEYVGGAVSNAVLAYLLHAGVVLAVCCTIGWLSRDYFEGPIRRLRVYLQ